MEDKINQTMSVDEIVSTLKDNHAFILMCLYDNDQVKNFFESSSIPGIQSAIEKMSFFSIIMKYNRLQRDDFEDFARMLLLNDKAEIKAFLETTMPDLVVQLQEILPPLSELPQQWKEFEDVYVMLVEHQEFFKNGLQKGLALERWLNRAENAEYRDKISQLESVIKKYFKKDDDTALDLFNNAVQDNATKWRDFLLTSPALLPELKNALKGANEAMIMWEHDQQQRQEDETVTNVLVEERNVLDQLVKTRHYQDSMIDALMKLKKIYPKEGGVDVRGFIKLFYLEMSDLPEYMVEPLTNIYILLEQNHDKSESEFLEQAKKLIYKPGTEQHQELIATILGDAQYYSKARKAISSGVRSALRQGTFFSPPVELMDEVQKSVKQISDKQNDLFKKSEKNPLVKRDSVNYYYIDTNHLFSAEGRLAAGMSLHKFEYASKLNLLKAFRDGLAAWNINDQLHDSMQYQLAGLDLPNAITDLRDYIAVNEAYSALSEVTTRQFNELKLFKKLFSDESFSNNFTEAQRIMVRQALDSLPDQIEVQGNIEESVNNIKKIILAYHKINEVIRLEDYPVAKETVAMAAVVEYEQALSMPIALKDEDNSNSDRRFIEAYLREPIDIPVNGLHNLMRVHQLHHLLMNSFGVKRLSRNQKEIQCRAEIIKLNNNIDMINDSLFRVDLLLNIAAIVELMNTNFIDSRYDEFRRNIEQHLLERNNQLYDKLSLIAKDYAGPSDLSQQLEKLGIAADQLQSLVKEIDGYVTTIQFNMVSDETKKDLIFTPSLAHRSLLELLTTDPTVEAISAIDLLTKKAPEKAPPKYTEFDDTDIDMAPKGVEKGKLRDSTEESLATRFRQIIVYHLTHDIDEDLNNKLSLEVNDYVAELKRSGEGVRAKHFTARLGEIADEYASKVDSDEENEVHPEPMHEWTQREPISRPSAPDPFEELSREASQEADADFPTDNADDQSKKMK